MASRHRGKSVLITGCTPGGIGEALAREFQRRGLFVIATARRDDVVSELRRSGLTTLALDVTSQDSIRACRAEVEELTDGGLDMLVNNAGVTHTIPATDIDMDDVRRTFETNVFGPMAMVHAFVPLLKRSQGLVVNISSIASRVAYTFGTVYSATKGAVNSWSRALRAELRPLGIRVTVVVAGTVRSNIASRSHRVLPPASYYNVVADVFRRRLTFSQSLGTMETPAFAREVADAVLRPEGWFGGWLGGRPDWLWAGGLAGYTWWLNAMSERLQDLVVGRVFSLDRLAQEVRRERLAKLA